MDRINCCVITAILLHSGDRRRMLVGLTFCFLLCLSLCAADAPPKAAPPPTADEEAQFRKFLSEELRLQLLPELSKFKHSGSQDWDRTTEKKIVIPAVEKTIAGKRIVITPRREFVIKYKDGDWLRYTATADEPDKTLQVEVLDFKQPDAQNVKFTVRLRGRAKADVDVKFYRLDVKLLELNGTVGADVTLLADCHATLKRNQDLTDVELKIEPRELETPNVELTRLGPLRGNEARKAGELLKELLGKDYRAGRDKLAEAAKGKIRQAVLKARVKNILLDLLLDKK